MKKLHLVITPFFPSENDFRGPFVYDSVVHLSKNKNHRVVVVKPFRLFLNPGIKVNYSFNGIEVLRCARAELPSGGFPGLFDGVNERYFLNFLSKNNIAVEEISVIHAHSAESIPYGISIKRINPRVKVIAYHHGLDILGFRNGFFNKSFFHKELVRRRRTGLLHAVDLNVGVSQRTVNQIHYSQKNPPPTYVLYNGVDLKKFYRPSSLNAKSGFCVGCVGNFSRIKDQITLIKAAELLIQQGMTDLTLRFIGQGPTRFECERYVNEHKILSSNVVFQDSALHEELVYFYHSLDLFILPSFYEAFGCVYTEAYACGVPFMACRGQGIEEFIPEEDKDKWLVEPHNFVGLSRMIKTFRENRFVQKLNCPIDIDYHMNEYLHFLKDKFDLD